MSRNWQIYIQQNFSLDLRALAIMRIGIALILLTDLSVRASSIVAHYTNEGVLPLDAMKAYCWNTHFFSFHALSGHLYWQVFLFSIAFVFALFLALGYRTRLSTILSWIMLLSLHNRNGYINQGGDDVLRILLFWAIFLPWGKRYSIDAGKSLTSLNNKAYFYNVAQLGYAILIFCLYFFSALLKDSPEWTTDGTALYYALSLDQLALPFSKFIYPYPGLLKFLTFLTYYAEIILPCLLFVPIYTNFFRCMAVFGIMLLHIGIGLHLYVGLFFLIGITSVIGLLPSFVMDRLEFLIQKKLSSGFSLHSLRKISTFPKKTSTNQMIERIKNNFYFRVALNSFLSFVIAFEVLWCLSVLPNSSYGVSQNFQAMGYFLRLDQNWAMFAPTVLKADGWYIYEAKTTSGKLIDINRNGEPVNYTKPVHVIQYIESDRWRKFGENYMLASNSPIRIYYCRYLFNKWNQAHSGEKIKELSLIYMLETTAPDYKYVCPKKETLITYPLKTLN